MQQLVIDRFEGKFAICENADQRYFAIETQELPEGAKEVPSWRFQVRGNFPSIRRKRSDAGRLLLSSRKKPLTDKRM